MRVAIIGTGGIAKVHVRLIRELDGELVAVCGRTSDSARSFATAPAYDDVTRMLREQKPDVVHVCSPNHLHAAHSVAAFEAGAHVLCEKPMATNTDECRRMIDAATKAGRVGAVAYTYRGYPLVEILRRKVADGEFGDAASGRRMLPVAGCFASRQICLAVHAWHDRAVVCADGSRYPLARSRRVRHRRANSRDHRAVFHASARTDLARRGRRGTAAARLSGR